MAVDNLARALALSASEASSNNGETEELLEIKIPIFSDFEGNLPSYVTLDEDSWENLKTVNTKICEGIFPTIKVVLIAGDEDFGLDVGAAIFTIITKPKHRFFNSVSYPIIDVNLMVDGDIIQFSIIGFSLIGNERNVAFSQVYLTPKNYVKFTVEDFHKIVYLERVSVEELLLIGDPQEAYNTQISSNLTLTAASNGIVAFGDLSPLGGNGMGFALTKGEEFGKIIEINEDGKLVILDLVDDNVAPIATEAYVSDIVGDINTLLDSINGEVIE